MRRFQLNIKKTFLFITISLSFVRAQFGYPTHDFLGGGIGYSPMYIFLDSIPGSSNLSNLGLDSKDFRDPFVVHGGEGFAHITGSWRIGGYAGVGATSISTVPNIIVYVEMNDTLGYQPPDNPDDPVDGVEDGKSVNYTDFFNPSIEAKFTLSIGAASVEYVMPLLQDLELSAGALFGIGRARISIDQQSGNPSWKSIFSNAYGTLDSAGTLYYAVSDDSSLTDPSIIPGQVPGIMRDMTTNFFNIQPYVAVKWQFLERVGLRISTGFNQGKIPGGRWSLNGRTSIGDSPTSTIQGWTFRTMVYIGL